MVKKNILKNRRNKEAYYFESLSYHTHTYIHKYVYRHTRDVFVFSMFFFVENNMGKKPLYKNNLRKLKKSLRKTRVSPPPPVFRSFFSFFCAKYLLVREDS